MISARRRRKPTLTPLIAVATLSLMATLPVLSNVRIYAAPSAQYAKVLVHPGDTLWTIAERHTTSEANVSDTVDEIARVNGIKDGKITPGQHLTIPNI